MITFLSIIEALALASALALDAFVASFAYGNDKVKIPFLSVQIISVVCSATLGISILAGTLLKQFIPQWLTMGICFTILIVLGMAKLLSSITKSIVRKHEHFSKEVKFSLFSLRFILHLCANPEDADIDASKTISSMEAASLAIALSLDGVAVGLGAALGNINGLAVVLCSLVTNALAVMLGSYIGNKVARKLPFNLSWLSGAVLIGLAVLKLF